MEKKENVDGAGVTFILAEPNLCKKRVMASFTGYI